jgi:two-component system C4-dicarboxylate transport response regulator DctD
MNTSSKPRSIAIVEDDPAMGALVVQMLALYGLPTQLFTGGFALLKSDALPTLKTIVMDLSLPDMDGFDLMQKLAERVPDVELVVMTGRGNATLESARMVAEGLGFRVAGALNKPFSHLELSLALKLGEPGIS